MIKNAATINVSKSSLLLYNDILQTSYLYIILTCVYQLDETDFGSVDIETEEIGSAFLEVDKIVSSALSNKPGLDLSSKFKVIIATLVQEYNYFLKV